MKWIALMPLVGIWLYVGDAYARCEQMEYAELKDMSQKEMTEIYCKQNKELIRAIKYNTATLNNGIKPNWNMENEQTQCEEVTHKIERIYKKRFPESVNSNGYVSIKCEEIKK
jgi:hypothetical protein